MTVAFDASGSTDPQGQALQYAWDFGDDSQATGGQVSHEYAVPGIYTVTLTVTDPQGNEASAITTARVFGPPIVDYFVNPVQGPEPLVVDVNAAGSFDPDGGPVEIRWDFGDGYQTTGAQASHRYRSGGSFPLTLTVTDDEGVVESRSEMIEVFETSVVTATFQQGDAGYEGTFEMRVRADGLVEAGSNVAEYYLDGRPQDAAQEMSDTCELIRFDDFVGNGPGQVPVNATVIRATLTYRTGTDVDAVTGVSLNTEGQLVITWTSVPGTAYQIDASGDFSAWEIVEANVPSQGVSTTYPHSVAGDPDSARFFRILTLNP